MTMTANPEFRVDPSSRETCTVPRQVAFQSGPFRQHILATAPAGFGKTTLLRDFHRQAIGAGVRVAWMTVLREHEDTATFIADIIRALQSLSCDLDPTFHKDTVPGHATGIREISRGICAHLSRSPDPLALFVDDYHSVGSNEAIGVFTEELLQSAPASFQVVLASRSAPNFSTIRLRMDNRLRQLSTRDLQFRQSEAEDFYRRIHGLVLSQKQLAQIVSRTEGWAAGLQLVALALKRNVLPDDVINSLSGDFREITEYLSRYVIEGLDSQMLRFMTDISVLDRLHPQLCGAVSQIPSAAALLTQMEEHGFFVRPLDESHTWFAYHELFRDFLRSRLKAEDGNRLHTLHRRASDWYAESHLPDRALEHALLAQDTDRAAQLIEHFGQERIDVGAMADVERWVNMIPPEVADRHPRLRVFKGWALCHIGKYHEAADILRELDQSRAASDVDPIRARELRYELAVLKVVNALAGDDVKAALEGLPADPPEPSKHMRRLSAMKANAEGACHIYMSRFDEAEQHLGRAYALHVQAGSLNGVMYSLCYLGYVRFLSGSLTEAQGKFEQAEQRALARSGKDSFSCALPCALRGLIADERDDPHLAESLITSRLTPVEEGAYIGFRRALFLRLARILMDRRQLSAADEILHRLLRSCDEVYIERTQLFINLEWARHSMRSGDHTEALRHLRRLPAPADLSTLQTWISDWCEPAVARAQFCLEEGEPARALEMLQPLKNLAQLSRRVSELQALLVLEARAAFSLGRQPLAASSLQQAVEIARKTGRQRVIADSRDIVLDLAGRLRIAHELERKPDEIMPGSNPGAANTAREIKLAPRACHPASSFGEALSAREAVVLQLVARGMRNKQVAAELNISEHTVRWHLRNVLEKLRVTNRTAAVSAARAMGLLPW
jgi:ATP/maltotriose-dependent transcriptional regulator MalT